MINKTTLFNSPGKRGVREKWNTPFLEFLHRTYSIKYRYMGLPGIDLYDVLLWKNMIDDVIAFELPAEPNAEDPHGRRMINELRKQMSVNNIRGHAYFGPMEEVILFGKDYDGLEYKQNKVITIYNFDFCDEISSPIFIKDKGRQVLRYEAISYILADQKRCYREKGEYSWFILLLTVRNQIDAIRLRNHLSKQNIYTDSKRYIDSCGGIDSLPVCGDTNYGHSWAMKAFIHDLFRQYLTNPHISTLFFPMVKYTGNPIVKYAKTGAITVKSPMLHYMTLCRIDDDGEAVPSFVPDDYLTNTTSVRAVDENNLVWEPEPGESKLKGMVTPVEWLNSLNNSFVNSIHF
jgi:hypothetical protein